MSQHNPSAEIRAGAPVYDESCLACRLTQKKKAPSERVACFVCRFKYRLKHLGPRSEA